LRELAPETNGGAAVVIYKGPAFHLVLLLGIEIVSQRVK
jgi:hypothetical protein